MIYLTKEYKFCAAHKYWNDNWTEQKNKEVFDQDIKIHGHNYTLSITVKGQINEDSGFIINITNIIRYGASSEKPLPSVRPVIFSKGN